MFILYSTLKCVFQGTFTGRLSVLLVQSGLCSLCVLWVGTCSWWDVLMRTFLRLCRRKIPSGWNLLDKYYSRSVWVKLGAAAASLSDWKGVSQEKQLARSAPSIWWKRRLSGEVNCMRIETEDEAEAEAQGSVCSKDCNRLLVRCPQSRAQI